MKRQSGILMPVFSLDSGYSIGDFGKSAYEFVDFLCLCGQKVWQILPLTKTGYSNSPYSSVYSRSFNPLFISLELLSKKGLIKKSELKELKCKSERVDYGKVYKIKTALLKVCFSRFNKQDEEFNKFLKGKEYFNYAIFSAISEKSGYAPFTTWGKGLKERDSKAINSFYKQNKNLVDFHAFTQFIAKKQWLELKEYANSKGIKILGDIPIYVSFDSVDVWQNPELFLLDENLNACAVAGVPPDYFCQDGQLWGNPVYAYSNHAKDNYKWWKARVKHALTVYDLVRIDHFRAFDRFYKINANEQTARNGVWVDGPKREIINAFSFAKNKIVAEDLGMIDDGVRELLKYSGYPGMKVLSFAYDGDKNNLHLPELALDNSVIYTGTHDNDTLMGLLNSLDCGAKERLKQGVKSSAKRLKVKVNLSTNKSITNSLITLALKSKSKLSIIPMQDYLALDQNYRVNRPGTADCGNWSIIISKKLLTSKKAKEIKRITELNGR